MAEQIVWQQIYNQLESIQNQLRDINQNQASLRTWQGWVDEFIRIYGPKIEALQTSDKIADAIETKLQQQDIKGWSHRERLIAALSVTFVAISTITNIALNIYNLSIHK